MPVRSARPVHPGEFLRDGIWCRSPCSPASTCQETERPRTRIERIAMDEIGITPDTALRLGRFCNTTPQCSMTSSLPMNWMPLASCLAKETADIEPIEAQAAAA